MYRQPDKEHMRARAVVVIALFLGSCSCTHRPVPREFVVPPDARNLEFSTVASGATCVRFNLKTPFPADEYLRAVKSRLEGASWQPLQGDLFEPKHPSSHVSGWSYYVDSSRNRERGVHQWLASWRSPSGAAVTYELQYSSPHPQSFLSLSAPTTDDLQVYCLLLSPQQVKATEESAGELEKKSRP